MNDFDNDIDTIYKEAKEIMYKGLGISFIIGLTAVLIALIVYK